MSGAGLEVQWSGLPCALTLPSWLWESALKMNETTPVRARFGPFRIDETEAVLERDGHPVDLAPRAFQVLCALLRHPGQLVTKDALLDAVWGHRHINEAALKNVVSHLRHALGDDARESSYVQTASRRGYRFIAPIRNVATRQEAQPPPAAPPSQAGLVGRAPELARLHAALAEARRGHRQMVLVMGDAGIGKSALVDRFVALSGTRVAFGQCTQHYGRMEPYMPVLEALNTLCRAEHGAGFIQAMRTIAPSWLLQLPWFVGDEDRQNLQVAAGGATQDRMLREFGELMEHTARADPPLLLVLEDLQWSDPATVQLLGLLARRRGPSACMVLGTFRPTEVVLEEHPLARLRHELRLHRLCTEIDLECLSETELGDLVAARLGEPAPKPFVRLLHAQTSGLPLFVGVVLDELASTGSLVRTDAGWQFPVAGALRPSIAGAVQSQLARLSPEQQRAIAAASVCGMEFQDLPLARVLDTSPSAVQALLDDAAARVPWLRCSGLTTLPDERILVRYAFSHAIYRNAVYDRLSAAQRQLWDRGWTAAIPNRDRNWTTLPAEDRTLSP
jgi:DNA-binding winged helix-turn-helix (wHTH) protein